MNLELVLQFVSDHGLLVGLFAVLFIMVFSYDRIHNQLSGLAILPHALVKLINHEQALVLDIRTSDLFRRGHVINAVNIPSAKLMKELTLLDSYKGRKVAIVCQREQEAAKLARLLRKGGQFPVVKILTGGVAKWRDASLPIEKEKG
ncbi:MAG: rhodanese-like domain-containing protein [Gammaproteobacteria bacterium]|nr:rhodanese-like domain-containing protein [Gammaproteobacteria bacterium]